MLRFFLVENGTIFSSALEVKLIANWLIESIIIDIAALSWLPQNLAGISVFLIYLLAILLSLNTPYRESSIFPYLPVTQHFEKLHVVRMLNE